MIYVYAIVPPDAQPPGRLRGHEDQPLRVAVGAGVAALFTRHAGGVAATAESIWRHEAVMERLMEHSPVLPVRFGTVLADEAKLSDLLLSNADALMRGLEKVRGRIELGVRAMWTEAAAAATTTSAPARSGREYMLARLEKERHDRHALDRAKILAEQLDHVFRPHAADSTCRVESTPPLLMTAAYLVERASVDGFRRSVAGATESHPDVRLLCTGPWPPYHFVPSLRVEGASA